MEMVLQQCRDRRVRSPAVLATILLLVALLVSASKTPSRDECRSYIDREQEGCQSPLGGVLGWISDVIFAESRYMKLREQAIAQRERDLIKYKVEQGHLPREALRRSTNTKATASTTTGHHGNRDTADQPSLLTRVWNELFAESRYMQQRREAIAAREQDLLRQKQSGQKVASAATHKRHGTAPETKKQPPTKADKIKKQVGQNTKKKMTEVRQPLPATLKAEEEQTSGGWLYDIIFAESKYMKLREEAITRRKQDLIRLKVSQGELPEEALLDPNYLDNQHGEDHEDNNLSLWDKFFCESRQFEIRRQALAARQRDLIEHKVAAGEMPEEALDNPELYTNSQSTNEPKPSIWELLFPEKEQLQIRADAIEKRRKDLILTKIKNGQLSEDALYNSDDEQSDDETPQSGTLIEMIFSEGRQLKIRQQALEERRRDLIRSKIRTGELPEEALDNEDFSAEVSDIAHSTPILQRIGNEIFAEGRYWEERNRAIADREADLQRMKLAQAGQTAYKDEPAETNKKKSIRNTPVKSTPEPTRPVKEKTPPKTSTPTTPKAEDRSPTTAPPPPPSTSTVRSRAEIERMLGLTTPVNRALEDAASRTLRELSQVVDKHIRQLETTYKYADISSRKLGETELFTKSMILFMGQLNSGKSTMINYLLGTEATKTTALPGSGQFRVLTYGEREEKYNGAQVARRQEFSDLQKYGEAFLERLSGRQLRNKLLERTNIVDVPGIMEGRQYSRLYPFNDVCQWFIDRADIIFVVFDPHHLDIGAEMENLLDQLKGHESQIRIILNKADQLPPADLLRVQTGLIWSLSPLLGSAVPPPPIFSGSFTSSEPSRQPGSEQLFRQQEEALLADIGRGVARRVANRVALARRHAVRVRNHARMVDCYLTTYLSQMTFLSNKKRLADDIVSNPHKYRIYEGISRLTNISRYDMPNPDLYEMFFSIHPLYEFPTLDSTCTYFGGCPLQTLETAIQNVLPDLLGRYRSTVERLTPKRQ